MLGGLDVGLNLRGLGSVVVVMVVVVVECHNSSEETV